MKQKKRAHDSQIVRADKLSHGGSCNNYNYEEGMITSIMTSQQKVKKSLLSIWDDPFLVWNSLLVSYKPTNTNVQICYSNSNYSELHENPPEL